MLILAITETYCTNSMDYPDVVLVAVIEMPVVLSEEETGNLVKELYPNTHDSRHSWEYKETRVLKSKQVEVRYLD